VSTPGKVVGAAAALLCAAALGGLAVAARAPRMASFVTPAAAAAPALIDPRAIAILVRAAVHEELAAQGGAAAGPAAAPACPGDAPAPAAAVPPPATAAQTEAAREGHRIVAAGRAAGIWDGEQARALHGLLGTLTQEDRRAVMAELFTAINAQELRLDGPPL
jgi:hypothetical protein